MSASVTSAAAAGCGGGGSGPRSSGPRRRSRARPRPRAIGWAASPPARRPSRDTSARSPGRSRAGPARRARRMPRTRPRGPSVRSRPMPDAVILDALRTPIGRYAGVLAPVRPDDLAARAIAAAVERNGIDPASVDEVYMGCTNQAGEDNRNVARMASLIAGLPQEVPGRDREPPVRVRPRGGRPGARRQIRLGEADLVLAGGVESMSRAPLVMLKPERGFPRGDGRAGGHHDRLALRQPEPRRALLDRVDGRDGRERGRALRRLARGPGRVRARVAPARRRGRRGGPLRRRDRHGRAAPAEGRPRHDPRRRGPARRTRRSSGWPS